MATRLLDGSAPHRAAEAARSGVPGFGTCIETALVETALAGNVAT